MIPPRSLTPVAQQLSDAIIIADPDGRVTWANPAFCKLSGYSLSELKGQKPGHLLRGPETDPVAARAMSDAVRQQRSFNVELVNYHKNGEPYVVAIALSPIRDRSGRVTGFMAVERETSSVQRELRRLENEIAQLYDILCRVTAGQPA